MWTRTASGPEVSFLSGGASAPGALPGCVEALLLALALTACSDTGSGDALPDSQADPEAVRCVRDDVQAPESALALVLGEASSGYICPVQDQDWYQLQVPEGQSLLSVALSIDSQLPVVQPVYEIWDRAADGEGPGEVVARPDPARVGGSLAQVHCLSSGAYWLVVRDELDDAEDKLFPYTLLLEGGAEPDMLEPNQDADLATSLEQGAPRSGFIACAGDQDWYVLDVPAGAVVSLSLTAPATGFQPRLQLLDAAGQSVLDESEPAAARDGTVIEFARRLATGGKYFVVVSDDDDTDGDPDVAYTLAVNLVQDDDPTEPNDHPDEAHALADTEVPCSASWSMEYTVTGSISAPADRDWFRLPTSGCAGGLVEAELTLDLSGLGASQAWELQTRLQADLALVRGHPDSPCADDLTCRTLSIPCEAGGDGWECAGYFNVCASDGLCAGATVCLPSGTCGANQVQRNYRSAVVPDSIEGPPPIANRAFISAPLLAGDDIWLRVSDFRSDAGDPAVPYRLQVKVRSDPDPGDAAGTPNNVFTPFLEQGSIPVRESQSVAVPVPVHDCVPRSDPQNPGAPPVMDCCDANSWVSGSISYENDLDFFSFPHPCPAEDCLLRMRYQVGDGAVDHGLFLYAGNSLFYSFEVGGDGVYGDDECLYAFQGHGDTYYVMLRDLVTQVDAAQPDRDRDPDQTYRFCIEKYQDTCGTPCAIAENGECTDGS